MWAQGFFWLQFQSLHRRLLSTFRGLHWRADNGLIVAVAGRFLTEKIEIGSSSLVIGCFFVWVRNLATQSDGIHRRVKVRGVITILRSCSGPSCRLCRLQCEAKSLVLRHRRPNKELLEDTVD